MATICSNPSGTAFARSCFAARTTSTSRAETCDRWIGTSRSCTRCCSSSCRAAWSWMAIVMPTARGLDFGGLQMRLHPAASRVEKLAKAAPAAFVAFDLLAANGKSLMSASQRERRTQLETLFKKMRPPLYLTPMTNDPKLAVEWLQRFEGAGLDGVIAKPAGASYEPGKRAMFKIKNVRSAACVGAGLRRYKSRTQT